MATLASGCFDIDPDTGELIVNPDLTLKPEFGGRALGSNVTYLPRVFGRFRRPWSPPLSNTPAKWTSAFRQRGAESTWARIRNRMRFCQFPASVRLGMGGLRRRRDAAHAWRIIGPDGNRSRAGSSGRHHLIAPESPANPFTDYINVFFPLAGLERQPKAPRQPAIYRRRRSRSCHSVGAAPRSQLGRVSTSVRRQLDEMPLGVRSSCWG